MLRAPLHMRADTYVTATTKNTTLAVSKELLDIEYWSGPSAMGEAEDWFFVSSTPKLARSRDKTNFLEKLQGEKKTS